MDDVLIDASILDSIYVHQNRYSTRLALFVVNKIIMTRAQIVTKNVINEDKQDMVQECEMHPAKCFF